VLEQRRVVCKFVFEIRVLDENDVRRGFSDAGSRGGAFSLITLVAQNLDACFLLGEVLQKFK